MLYNKLFNLSQLSDTEIKHRLNISKQQLRQFRESEVINSDRFIRFCKALGVSDKDATELVINEIRKLWQKTT
jgi:DNA-binding Xre family transcriptional regulator